MEEKSKPRVKTKFVLFTIQLLIQSQISYLYKSLSIDLSYFETHDPLKILLSSKSQLFFHSGREQCCINIKVMKV